MKPYKVYIDVTNRFSLEIHGHDQDDAQAQAEKLTTFQVEHGGDYEKVIEIEVVDVEPLFPPDDEDGPIVQEAIGLDSLRAEPEEIEEEECEGEEEE